MLRELRVQNLLLIEHAELALGPGLNVMTGETGAGKTVLAHALDLLLGGRARPAIVRPGAREAYVEGLFEPAPAILGAELEERLGMDPGATPAAGPPEILLARRVGADGRTRAYVNGRGVTLAELRELGSRLISFYGQHEHRKLTLAAAQLEILDAHCDPGQRRRLEDCARSHARLRELDSRLAELQGIDAEGELDLLEHELAQIEAAQLSPESHAELLARRERLARLDSLISAAGGAGALLSGESDAGAEASGAAPLLAAAADRLEGAGGADPLLDALAGRLQTLAIEAQELAAELRERAEALAEEDSEPLAALLERLDAMERIIRRHGGTVEGALDYARRAGERRAFLLEARDDRDRITARVEEERERLRQAARALHEARAAAAPRLAADVREQLEGLAMGQASFSVELHEREIGPAGSDTVQFRIAPNPGVPEGPLGDIASGGELSRVMLAISTAGILSAEPSPGATLVFDEIDAGIGGQTARAVGERLRALGEIRQVLCITHLPQIASLGSRHFSIVKDPSADPARTSVLELSEGEVVQELVRMLGAEEHDRDARRHAERLRAAA